MSRSTDPEARDPDGDGAPHPAPDGVGGDGGSSDDDGQPDDVGQTGTLGDHGAGAEDGAE